MDVTKHDLRDHMDSYFLAETCKYLYLIFTPNNFVNQGNFVFNTEGHLFPIVREFVKMNYDYSFLGDNDIILSDTLGKEQCPIIKYNSVSIFDMVYHKSQEDVKQEPPPPPPPVPMPQPVPLKIPVMQLEGNSLTNILLDLFRVEKSKDTTSTESQDEMKEKTLAKLIQEPNFQSNVPFIKQISLSDLLKAEKHQKENSPTSEKPQSLENILIPKDQILPVKVKSDHTPNSIIASTEYQNLLQMYTKLQQQYAKLNEEKELISNSNNHLRAALKENLELIQLCSREQTFLSQRIETCTADIQTFIQTINTLSTENAHLNSILSQIRQLLDTPPSSSSKN